MKKIYYILALAMVGAMSFTSCSKDEPENPAEETQQTETEKHFKSAKAVYSLKTSNIDPYFTASFSYLDAEGKLQNATVSDDAPFELTFDAKIGTKVQVTNLVFTPKAGVATSERPTCRLRFQYGFDIVDAIDGKTYKSGFDLECNSYDKESIKTLEDVLNYFNELAPNGSEHATPFTFEYDKDYKLEHGWINKRD